MSERKLDVEISVNYDWVSFLLLVMIIFFGGNLIIVVSLESIRKFLVTFNRLSLLLPCMPPLFLEIVCRLTEKKSKNLFLVQLNEQNV